MAGRGNGEEHVARAAEGRAGAGARSLLTPQHPRDCSSYHQPSKATTSRGHRDERFCPSDADQSKRTDLHGEGQQRRLSLPRIKARAAAEILAPCLFRGWDLGLGAESRLGLGASKQT